MLIYVSNSVLLIYVFHCSCHICLTALLLHSESYKIFDRFLYFKFNHQYRIRLSLKIFQKPVCMIFVFRFLLKFFFYMLLLILCVIFAVRLNFHSDLLHILFLLFSSISFHLLFPFHFFHVPLVSCRCHCKASITGCCRPD